MKSLDYEEGGRVTIMWLSELNGSSYTSTSAEISLRWPASDPL